MYVLCIKLPIFNSIQHVLLQFPSTSDFQYNETQNYIHDVMLWYKNLVTLKNNTDIFAVLEP